MAQEKLLEELSDPKSKICAEPFGNAQGRLRPSI
jgi:hypothetical protein